MTNDKPKRQWSGPLNLALTMVLAIFTGLLWWQAVQTDKRTLRAWVSVKGGSMQLPEVGKEVTGSIIMVNSGETPATDLKAAAVVRVFPASMSGDALLSAVNYAEDAGSNALGPTLENTLSASYQNLSTNGRTMDEGTLKSLQDKTSLLFMFGKITYNDIYGEEHTTTFCAYWNLTQAAKNLTACKRGNVVQ